MHIPLVYFLIAWMGLLAILGLVAVLSAMQMLRYGIAGTATTGFTFVFMAVGLTATLATSAYLTTIDWKQSIEPLSVISSINPLGGPDQQP